MEQKLKRVVIKEELVELTEDFIEAIILNQFIYWSERTKDFDKLLLEQKNLAEGNNEINNADFLYGWIYKSASELSEEIMIKSSDTTIRRHVSSLVKKGYLLQRNNPKYKWDRTLQYKVNFNYIIKSLNQLGYHLEGYKLLEIDMDKEENEIEYGQTINENTDDECKLQNENMQDASMNHACSKMKNGNTILEHGSFIMKNRMDENAGALPEITTETTTESEKKLATLGCIASSEVKRNDQRSVLLQSKSPEESGKKLATLGCMASSEVKRNDQRSALLQSKSLEDSGKKPTVPGCMASSELANDQHSTFLQSKSLEESDKKSTLQNSTPQQKNCKLPPTTTLQEKKQNYKDFLFFYASEIEKLHELYGENTTNIYMNRLNNHIGIHGKQKKIKSHYHQLMRWLQDDSISLLSKTEMENNSSFSVLESMMNAST